jgi:hypothetical protein
VTDPITQTGEQQRQTGPRAGLWSRLRDRFTREPSK